jgi:hypothetical protein
LDNATAFNYQIERIGGLFIPFYQVVKRRIIGLEAQWSFSIKITKTRMFLSRKKETLFFTSKRRRKEKQFAKKKKFLKQIWKFFEFLTKFETEEKKESFELKCFCLKDAVIRTQRYKHFFIVCWRWGKIS